MTTDAASDYPYLLNLAGKHAKELQATVEVLRERVAEEQELKQGYYDEAAKGWIRARAAEARVAELEEALQANDVLAAKADVR